MTATTKIKSKWWDVKMVSHVKRERELFQKYKKIEFFEVFSFLIINKTHKIFIVSTIKAGFCIFIVIFIVLNP